MKIERMNKGSWGKVRAFFDVTTSDGFTIKGFKIIEGINGLFVSLPSQKGNDDEYYDTVWLESKELRDQLNQVALDHYGSQYSETLSPQSTNKTEEEAVPTTPETDESKGEREVEKKEPFSEDDIPF
tara:strand:- start:975 stop:1355 length:381 start_codon:yes stop_codon:yes gene_type:complete